MSNVELWIVVGFLFGLFVMGIVFLLSMSGPKKRRRVPKPMKEKEQRDWKQAALRLEKHISDLRKENIEWQKRIRILEREKEIYQKKGNELAERLKREKSWQQKENEETGKKNLRIKELQEELRHVESRMESEHLEFVLLKRHNEELRQENDGEAETIRRLSVELEKSKAQSDIYRKEILELRSENKKLSKRHDDVQWIAKSVHMKVKEELRQKTEELEKLKQQINK